MNRVTLVFGVILVTAIMCQPSGLKAQDPNDPGEPDTLYFTPGSMHSPTGDTLYVWPDTFPQDVILYMNFWNDNPIVTIVTPFIDTCNGPPCNADLDESKNNTEGDPPICYGGSRIAHFSTLVAKFWYYPPNFYLGAVAVTADPVPPGDGLLATFIFTVNDTGRICLDSCFWPPSMNLQFVTTDAQGYAPVFEKTTFVISKCEYSPADPNYDWSTDLTDLVYLINYVLKHGPRPCVLESGDMNCDGSVNVVDVVYFVNYLFRDGPAPGYCP